MGVSDTIILNSYWKYTRLKPLQLTGPVLTMMFQPLMLLSTLCQRILSTDLHLYIFLSSEKDPFSFTSETLNMIPPVPKAPKMSTSSVSPLN